MDARVGIAWQTSNDYWASVGEASFSTDPLSGHGNQLCLDQVTQIAGAIPDALKDNTTLNHLDAINHRDFFDHIKSRAAYYEMEKRWPQSITGWWLVIGDWWVVSQSVSPEVRKSGSPEVRKSGSLEVRKSGSPEVWKSGSLEVRKSGSLKVRKSESILIAPHLTPNTSTSYLTPLTSHSFIIQNQRQPILPTTYYDHFGIRRISQL